MTRVGPVVLLTISCAACQYELPQLDGGSLCAAPTVTGEHGEPRRIPKLETPRWCPLRAQAIAAAAMEAIG